MKLNTKNFLNNETSWNIKKDSLIIGKLTSVSFSPRLKYNIGLGIIDANYSKIGSKFIVEAYEELVEAEVVPLPFMDKKQMVNAKELAKKFYSN
jgi:glycine cleavage system aminomethyltransferase T